MQSSDSTIKPIALAFAMALLLNACSSGSDSANGEEASTETTNAVAGSGDTSGDPEPDPEPADGSTNPDYDCDALEQHNLVVRQAVSWIPQVMAEEDPEFLELMGDLDSVEAAIEGLRPIQDIDSGLGTAREGLDNMAADIAAIRDETYGEPAGGYSIVAIGMAIGEEACQ